PEGRAALRSGLARVAVVARAGLNGADRVESTVSRLSRAARGFRGLNEEQSTDSRLYNAAFDVPVDFPKVALR
ncbi:hypothetical protein, partial [Stenotrophomonas maltophilia]|uniref:hypothetical protein n=1 Tax=Stenotrophomonas maltophilia TaxID=40324 RepID=UPI0021C85B55